MPHAMRIFPITNIAIAPDPAGMFAACEDAYEQATREGYAENPAVTAALTGLKSAWMALQIANCNLMTAKGFFAVRFATFHADRAARATRKACVDFQAAIAQAAAENRLNNRCLVLTRRSAA